MKLLGGFGLNCLFHHLQDKIDVVPHDLGALRVARELECIRRYGLHHFFKEGDHEVDRITSDNLGSH